MVSDMTTVNALTGLDQIAGTLIGPDHDGYDAARQTFNGTIDRRPAAIVQCRSTADVVAAVRAARDAGLAIAVRGGGHSVAGHAVADGALVVDLREMRRVDVDPERRIARAQGGALWEDVDLATTAHGLATTGGTFGDTGIGGLTLTGGIGFLMGTLGLGRRIRIDEEIRVVSGYALAIALHRHRPGLRRPELELGEQRQGERERVEARTKVRARGGHADTQLAHMEI